LIGVDYTIFFKLDPHLLPGGSGVAGPWSLGTVVKFAAFSY